MLSVQGVRAIRHLKKPPEFFHCSFGFMFGFTGSFFGWAKSSCQATSKLVCRAWPPGARQ